MPLVRAKTLSKSVRSASCSMSTAACLAARADRFARRRQQVPSTPPVGYVLAGGVAGDLVTVVIVERPAGIGGLRPRQGGDRRQFRRIDPGARDRRPVDQ